MVRAKEAIRYGVETLGISAEKMFSLIESSNGYDGDDYQRWLADKIIKIAESDGVGYSQLLIKKFSIISSLMEEYATGDLKESFLGYLKGKYLTEDNKVFTLGIDWFNTDNLDEIDLFNGIDFDFENSFFFKECMPVGLQERFFNGEKVTMFCRLSSNQADKNSELYKEAKQQGILCKTEGSLLLYRLCRVLTAFEDDYKSLTFTFISDSEFLSNADNQDAIKYFLKYFKYSGFYVNACDMYEKSYIQGRYCIVDCVPALITDEIQDGFVLPEFNTSGNELRFSNSEVDMYQILSKMETGLRLANPNSVLGYLSLDKGSLQLGTSGVIPIELNTQSYQEAITYYVLFKSLKGFGVSSAITGLVTGSSTFTELFYNCLPVFMLDTSSNLNYFNLKEKLGNLLEQGEVYYSFEAKNLLEIAKAIEGIVLKDNSNNDITTFAELLEIAVQLNKDLYNQFLTAYERLKDYVSMLYRR